MNGMTTREAAEKWGLTERSVQIHCRKGNVPGAALHGKSWLIPSDAEKPARKPRAKGRPRSVLDALRAEKRGRVSGGLYHRLQIDFAFNSNHIEGSRLTHEQTRWIFETQTVGSLSPDMPIDDVIETANHFRCLDYVIESANAALSERYMKTLHSLLKGGTGDSRKEWFFVGDYKRLDNMVGDMDTCPAADVPGEMARLVSEYAATEKSLEDILEFHVRFERIHPFQDGNGRVGRLIMLKECLKYGHIPFVIGESLRQFYYKGLDEWRRGSRARIKDVCGTGQEVFNAALVKFGYVNLANDSGVLSSS